MKKVLIILSLFGCLLIAKNTNAQPPVKLVNGKLLINDGSLIYKKAKYASFIDTINKKLQRNPRDTTSLFYHALLFDLLNDQMAKPVPSDKEALVSLMRAKDSCEKAVGLKMQNFKLKVLRAQIYKDLVYRYAADEAWQFNSKEIADRKSMFNTYKDLANKYYDELAQVDKANAYDYQKLKVTNKYPL